MDFEAKEYSPKPFEFSGKSGEFFGIWIVNIALTILTLGIYSAWAKVRTNQYFYGNTALDGSAFQYLATPMQILKGRIIASVFFGVYYVLTTMFPLWGLGFTAFLVLVIPAIIVLSLSFRMRNTAYRNVSFRFDRNFKQAYLVYAGPAVVFTILFALSFAMAISEDAEIFNGIEITQQSESSENLGNSESSQSTEISLNSEELEPPIAIFAVLILMFTALPFWEYLKTHFLVTNTRFGTSPFNFEAKASNFYKLYLLAFLIFACVLFLFGFAVKEFTSFSPDNPELTTGFSSLIPVISGVFFYFWAFAYIQTKRANLIYNHASIQNMQMDSQLTVTYMFFLYITNTLAILVSLGLLIPWSMIRTARYRASTLTILSDTNLETFVADQQQELSALGEELGEVFDIEIGI